MAIDYASRWRIVGIVNTHTTTAKGAGAIAAHEMELADHVRFRMDSGFAVTNNEARFAELCYAAKRGEAHTYCIDGKRYFKRDISRDEYRSLNDLSGRGRSIARAECGGEDSYSVTFNSKGEVIDLFHWFGPSF